MRARAAWVRREIPAACKRVVIVLGLTGPIGVATWGGGEATTRGLEMVDTGSPQLNGSVNVIFVPRPKKLDTL